MIALTMGRRCNGGPLRAAMFAAFALLAACGDNAAGGGAAGSAGSSRPVGDKCTQAGYTETGCACEGGEVGHRTCTDALAWTACSCRPRPAACSAGERVLCTCPRDAGQRETTCLVGGTFDCPCDEPPVPSGELDAG